jgi:hypothetical protein
LPTNAHFSSNWTSRVAGGKSHDLVVGVFGVLTGQEYQPGDGVLADPHQAGGLSGPAAVVEVLQDPSDLVVGELGVEVGRPLELGEPGLAGLAVQEPVVILAVVGADREVAGAAAAVFRAVRVLTAMAREVVRGHGSSWIEQGRCNWSWTAMLASATMTFNYRRTPPAGPLDANARMA